MLLTIMFKKGMANMKISQMKFYASLAIAAWLFTQTSVASNSVFRGIGTCAKADLGKIEKNVASGFVKKIFPELKNIFQKKGIVLKREMVSIEKMNYDARETFLRARPVFKVNLGNGNIYSFSLEKEIIGVYLNDIQLDFAIGTGLVSYSTEYDSLGEIKLKGCHTYIWPMLDEGEVLKIVNDKTKQTVAYAIVLETFHVWE